jgi:hypothetical protein
VEAKKDVPVENLVKQAPVEGGRSTLAVRLDETIPTRGGPLVSAELRLRHLLGKIEPAAPSKPPKAEVLSRAVENVLGRHALHLSATEVATLLGAPSWAAAIAELGPPHCLESAQMEDIKISARLEKLSPWAGDWIALKLGDEIYRGSRADWMRIAKSPATPPEVLHELLVTVLEEQPGRGGRYMDPIALAILESKHDLPEKTIDLVLDRQLLPWVARLVNNEAINERQQDRLLDWLEKAYWNAAGVNESRPVEKYAAVAVTGDDATGHKYWFADVVEQGGRTYLAHRVTTVRDNVVNQASDILFGHPRAPHYLKEAVLRDPYGVARFGQASTVIRMRSPVWGTEELDKLFPEMLSAAWSHLQNATSRDPAREFGYDLVLAFRDHPNASQLLVAQAEGELRRMKSFLVDDRKQTVELRGLEGWQMSPLGIPLPTYP